MHTFSAAALAAFIPLVYAAVDLSSIPRVTSARVVDGAYIVELDNANRLGKRSFSPHVEFYRGLEKRGASWDLVKEFNDPEIFVGASVTVKDESDLTALASVEGVKSVHPVFIHPRPPTFKYHVPTGKDDTRLPPDTFSTHRMTGVDKLHAEGVLGKGIKIAVLDTGIDYTHPTLGGGFGAGFKVYMGHDFVGDNYTGERGAVPDEDPIDQCAGHGTHVAGTIAASRDKEYNFTGVAPEALLGAYRVFGCEGGVGDDILVDALMRAYKDGNDILSLSLGGAQGWSSAVTAVVASRIAAKGRVVTIAAGNDGRYGGWYASAPGVAIDAISVASVENIETVVQTATLSNGHAPIGYGSFKPLNITGERPIYPISKDTSVANDACEPLGADVPDLSSYLVLVRRGSCTFVKKIENIKAKGATAALIYDNTAGISGGISVGDFPAAIITQDDGKYLVGEFVAGREVKMSFPQSGASTTIESPEGGLMSVFSSFGPVNDLWFKPSLAAPGGNILSTIPVPLGSYAIQSGTSMATPFVAGAAALLLEAKGKKRSVYIGARSMLQSTASLVPSSHSDGAPPQTLAQSGAGLINVYNALHYQTEITPTQLHLNDTARAHLEHTIRMWNHDKNTQVYTISHEPVGTALTVQGIEPIPTPVPLKGVYATMTSSHKTVRVRPGFYNDFVVKFTPPKGLDPASFPVYSGHVVVKSDKEELRVSYLGVASSTKDLKVIDNSEAYFGIPLPQILTPAGEPQNGTTTYTFQGDDFPFIVYRLVAGTADLVIDLLEHGKVVGQQQPTGKLVGTLARYNFQSRNSNGDYESSGYSTFAWNKPVLPGGKVVPNGLYNIRIRALKISGDSKKSEDWDSWVGPVVDVKAGNGPEPPIADEPSSVEPATISSSVHVVTTPSTSAAPTP